MTKNEILTLVYEEAINSSLQPLSGGVYKNVRPTGSTAVDTVISLFAGITGKFLQNGTILLRIFYPDLLQDNTYYEDSSKGEELEKLLLDFSNQLLAMNTISFEVQTRETKTIKVMESDEHVAILSMNFLLTNN